MSFKRNRGWDMRKGFRRSCAVITGLALISFLYVAVDKPSDLAASTVTFTKDVAPILFKNCAECHRTGEIAPMSLMNYQEARPWARAIRERVVERSMPPWSADPNHGRSEEHTSELQSLRHLVCRLLLEKKNFQTAHAQPPGTSAALSLPVRWRFLLLSRLAACAGFVLIRTTFVRRCQPALVLLSSLGG